MTEGVGPELRYSGVLREAIRLWSDKLKISLQETRGSFEHRGERGGANEAAFRGFLRAHLSPKYRVGCGEVIDAFGRRSRQLDVAIVDEEQPFVVDDSAQRLIIEGIGAAGEVKTVLTGAGLADCIEKGRAFKSLVPILGKYWALAGLTLDDGVRNSDFPRFYERRPFFVFAYEGKISSDALLAALTASEREGQVPPVDAVFILDQGFAINLWDGNGQLAFLEPETGRRIGGWVVVPDPTGSLVQLMLWLSASMPRFGMRSSPLFSYLVPGMFVGNTPIEFPNQSPPTT